MAEIQDNVVSLKLTMDGADFSKSLTAVSGSISKMDKSLSSLWDNYNKATTAGAKVSALQKIQEFNQKAIENTTQKLKDQEAEMQRLQALEAGGTDTSKQQEKLAVAITKTQEALKGLEQSDKSAQAEAGKWSGISGLWEQLKIKLNNLSDASKAVLTGFATAVSTKALDAIGSALSSVINVAEKVGKSLLDVFTPLGSMSEINEGMTNIKSLQNSLQFMGKSADEASAMAHSLNNEFADFAIKAGVPVSDLTELATRLSNAGIESDKLGSMTKNLYSVFSATAPSAQALKNGVQQLTEMFELNAVSQQHLKPLMTDLGISSDMLRTAFEQLHAQGMKFDFDSAFKNGKLSAEDFAGAVHDGAVKGSDLGAALEEIGKNPAIQAQVGNAKNLGEVFDNAKVRIEDAWVSLITGSSDSQMAVAKLDSLVKELTNTFTENIKGIDLTAIGNAFLSGFTGGEFNITSLQSIITQIFTALKDPAVWENLGKMSKGALDTLQSGFEWLNDNLPTVLSQLEGITEAVKNLMVDMGLYTSNAQKSLNELGTYYDAQLGVMDDSGKRFRDSQEVEFNALAQEAIKSFDKLGSGTQKALGDILKGNGNTAKDIQTLWDSSDFGKTFKKMSADVGLTAEQAKSIFSKMAENMSGSGASVGEFYGTMFAGLVKSGTTSSKELETLFVNNGKMMATQGKLGGDGFTSAINSAIGTIKPAEIKSDTSQAIKAVQGFTDWANQQSATVKITANVGQTANAVKNAMSGGKSLSRTDGVQNVTVGENNSSGNTTNTFNITGSAQDAKVIASEIKRRNLLS